MLKIYFTRKNENYIILNTLLKNNIYTCMYLYDLQNGKIRIGLQV